MKARAARAGASKKRAATDPNFCCEQWARFPEGSRTWGWQVIHAFGHSRTTFSVATVATKAAITTEQAASIVRDAVNFKWVAHTDQTGIYVGRLTAWRKT